MRLQAEILHGRSCCNFTCCLSLTFSKLPHPGPVWSSFGFNTQTVCCAFTCTRGEMFYELPSLAQVVAQSGALENHVVLVNLWGIECDLSIYATLAGRSDGWRAGLLSSEPCYLLWFPDRLQDSSFLKMEKFHFLIELFICLTMGGEQTHSLEMMATSQVLGHWCDEGWSWQTSWHW